MLPSGSTPGIGQDHFCPYYLSESFVSTDTPVSVTSPPRSSPPIALTAAFTPSEPITSGFCAIVQRR